MVFAALDRSRSATLIFTRMRCRESVPLRGGLRHGGLRVFFPPWSLGGAKEGLEGV